MKKLILGLIATVLFSTNVEAKNSIKTVETNKVECINSLKRIKINMSITDDDGGVWNISGYVDVSLLGNINGYDITITHDGHTYHFHGKIARVKNKDGSFSSSVDGQLEENGKTVEITQRINSVLINCDNQVVRENQ
jgi:hypothetical protein